MKSSKNITLLTFSLFVLALFYVSCKKNGGVDPNSPAAHKQAYQESLRVFIQPAYNIYWRNAYNKQGSVIVKPDSCNKLATYHFTTANLNSEGSEGYVFIDYYNAPCSQATIGRDKQPQNVLYTFTVNPNTLSFPDNGYDLTFFTYNVLKLSADSLVLRSQKTPSLVKVYLPFK